MRVAWRQSVQFSFQKAHAQKRTHVVYSPWTYLLSSNWNLYGQLILLHISRSRSNKEGILIGLIILKNKRISIFLSLECKYSNNWSQSWTSRLRLNGHVQIVRPLYVHEHVFLAINKNEIILVFRNLFITTLTCAILRLGLLFATDNIATASSCPWFCYSVWELPTRI